MYLIQKLKNIRAFTEEGEELDYTICNSEDIYILLNEIIYT